MLKKIYTCISFCILSVNALIAQTVYLQSMHPVYEFLNAMESRHIIIDYRDAMKPLSRKEIARHLSSIDTTQFVLTSIEKAQLQYYREEFYQELRFFALDTTIAERPHIYQYHDSTSVFNVDFVGGIAYEQRGDGRFRQIINNGIQAYGYVGSSLGISFYFRDNHDKGTYVDRFRTFSPEQAQIPAAEKPNLFEYTIIDAQAVYEHRYGTVSIEKMNNVWGNGRNGAVIFSNKVPSYPQIKLKLKLGKDIDFTYFHGSLFSGLIDSVRTFEVYTVPPPLNIRTIYKQKYVAAHMFEFSPFTGIDIALGESEVYGSRNPELLYLIPFMFFKVGEHWMYDTDNTQMFASLDLNVIPSVKLYGTLFIDELATGDVFDADKAKNQIAYVLGGSYYNLFIDDLQANLEYTHMNPWVYNHKFTDATFQTHDVDLGHWLGQNADLLFLGVTYRPFWNMKCSIEFESLRKGGKDSTLYQYELPPEKFLYGPVTKQQSLKIECNYEVVRDIQVTAYISRQRYTSEIGLLGPDYSGNFEYFAGIRYNIY